MHDRPRLTSTSSPRRQKMFGFGKKDRKIKELMTANCTLAGELSEAKDDSKTYAAMADQRMATIQGYKDRTKELEVSLQEAYESEKLINQRLTETKAENAKLRDGAGHALHALAAVQDLSTAFVKRLDMLPPYCGLPQDLVQEVFADFDTDLHQLQDYAREITRQSYTIEEHSDDKGMLVKAPDDNSTHFLDPIEVRESIKNSDHWPEWEGTSPLGITWPIDEIVKIHELGLYTLQLDLGKNVKADLKLWVVPKADGMS